LASLNQSYNQLMTIIKGNLDFLKLSEGKVNIMDFDLIQVLMVHQNQIKHLVHEFYKTSSFMYGFALELASVSEVLRFPEKHVVKPTNPSVN